MTSPATVAHPDNAAIELPTVRVSVMTPSLQVDVDLAYTLPLAEVVPALIRMLNSVLEAKGQTPITGGKEAQQWSLGRLGFTPIPLTQSLKNGGVHDGDLLILQSLTKPQSPAMFDDVIDAVAQLEESRRPTWGQQAAENLGLSAAVLSSLIIAWTFLKNPIAQPYVSAGIGIAAGLLFIIASVIQARFYSHGRIATILALSSYPLLLAGVSLLPSHTVTALGLCIGFFTVFVAAAVVSAIILTGLVYQLAVMVPALIGAIASLVAALWHDHTSGIAAIFAGVSLILLGLSPRLAIVAARIPLPRVPTTGESIAAMHEGGSPVIEGVGSLGSVVLPEAAGLERRVTTAWEFLTGIIIGATAAVTLTTLASAITSRGNDYRLVILVAMMGSILALRGRLFTDQLQAGAMIIGGIITSAVGLGVLAVKDSGVDQYLSLGLLLALILVCITAGSKGSKITASPLTQRSVEILTYLLLTLVVPLIFWISDIYNVLRHG